MIFTGRGFVFDYISATKASDKFAFLHKNNHNANVTINQGSNNKNEVNIYDFVSNNYSFCSEWLTEGNAILLKIQYNFDNILPVMRRNYDNKKRNYLPRIAATETNWFRSIKRILSRPKWLLNATSSVDSRRSQRASNRQRKQLLSDLTNKHWKGTANEFTSKLLRFGALVVSHALFNGMRLFFLWDL